MVGERPRSQRRSTRRKRLWTRTAPLGVVAVLSFAAGVFTGTAPGRAERHLVQQYVSAWARGDYSKMYSLLDSGSRATTTLAQFEAAYRAAAATATLSSITPLHVASRVGQDIPVLVRIHTRVFGTLRETLQVPLAGSGSGASVKYSRELLFPGLEPGEQLRRHVTLACPSGSARQRWHPAGAGSRPDQPDP